MALWNNHVEHLSDDCARQLQDKYGIEEPTADQVTSLALCMIRDILRASNSSLEAHRLPLPQHEFQPVLDGENLFIHDEYNYDVNVLREVVLHDVGRLIPEQRNAYDALCSAVENGRGGLFFLNGFGGTGKTFVINLTLAKLRSERKIAVAVASSGHFSMSRERLDSAVRHEVVQAHGVVERHAGGRAAGVGQPRGHIGRTRPAARSSKR